MAKELQSKDRNTEITEMIRWQRASSARSKAAQTCVIGLLLILGTALVATTLYLAIEAPIETKRCEFLHATEVTASFITLNTHMMLLLHANSPLASTSVPIKITATKGSFIALPLASGSLSFSPTEGSITVKLDAQGTNTSGSWHDDDFTNTTTNKVDTSSGNVTLVGPPYSMGYIESNMSSAEGHIGKDTGSDSTVYEQITWNTILPMNTRIILKVRTDMFPNMTHAKAWYECPELESQTGFNKINLSGLSSVSNGHRYVQYHAELKTLDVSKTPTLTDLSINFSSPLNGVILSQSSGSLIFSSEYHYLPNQELAYEHGAVIKSQEKEQGFVIHNPPFSISNANGVPRLNLSQIHLIGTNVTRSGSLATSVKLYNRGYTLVSDSLYYPNATITLSSNYATAWKKWFDEELETSNLTASYDYSSPNVTDGTVTVEFYGNGEGVQVLLEKTIIQVDVLK